MAEVVYCFEMGKIVLLAAGGVCRVEQLKPGMQFQLKEGGFGTVTNVKQPIPWPEQPPVPDRNGNVMRRVLGKVKHIGYTVVDVVFAGQVVTTTPNHRFKLTRGEWVDAGKLCRGDSLEGLDRQAVPVESVSAPRHGFIELYNIEFEVSHTYYVKGKSANGSAVEGILVHNGYDCIRLPAEQAAEKLTFRGARIIDGLREATHADIVKAFRGTGFEVTGHFISRLKDVRTGALGLRTFADLQRIFRNGEIVAQEGRKAAIVFDRFKIVFDTQTRRLVTLSPW